MIKHEKHIDNRANISENSDKFLSLFSKKSEDKIPRSQKRRFIR